MARQLLDLLTGTALSNRDAEPERQLPEMEEEMKNGWHVIQGSKVHVEDGRIDRAIKGSGLKETSASIYRWSRKMQCWTQDIPLTVAAFRAGVRRGTVEVK